MADVFLSYAHEDRAVAEELALAIEQSGRSVWWDPVIRAGEDFSHRIERELERAALVVVLWSQASVSSRYVRDEADAGLARDALLPVRIDNASPPLGFRRLHTVDLAAASGPRGDSLVHELEKRVALPETPSSGVLTRPLADGPSRQGWLLFAFVAVMLLILALWRVLE